MNESNQTEPRAVTPVWKLRQLDCARRQAAAAAFANVPLTDPAQHFMLFYVEKCADTGVLPSQREIAAGMHLAPATVTATLRALEKLGLICRTPDDTDMRINRVDITEAGRAIAGECRQRMDLLEEQLLRGFSQQEQQLLSALLDRMESNLRPLYQKEDPAIDP